jgi:hypothetical protein
LRKVWLKCKRRSIHTQSLNEIEAFPIKSNVPPSEMKRSVGLILCVIIAKREAKRRAWQAWLTLGERALRNAS